MSQPNRNLLECCLYFTANSLARSVTRIAEESFGRLGLAPSHAFLVSLVVETPGMSQKALAEQLHLAPSTVSRFVDALARRGLVEKRGQGRSSLVWPTTEGEALSPAIQAAWKDIYHRYSAVLGEAEGQALTRAAAEACAKLDAEP